VYSPRGHPHPITFYTLKQSIPPGHPRDITPTQGPWSLALSCYNRESLSETMSSFVPNVILKIRVHSVEERNWKKQLGRRMGGRGDEVRDYGGGTVWRETWDVDREGKERGTWAADRGNWRLLIEKVVEEKWGKTKRSKNKASTEERNHL